jgi:hypothetical protein
MNIITLPDFVSFLNDQKSEDFRGGKIDNFLLSNRVEQDDFVPFIYFREETYCRNLVFKNEFFELLVLTWLPHQKTPILGYAGQRSWMMVQSGVLTLQSYRAIKSDGMDPTVELETVGESTVRAAGDQVYGDDQLDLYSIANATRKPAVSVHLNAAPVSECRIYNERQKNVEWVELGYDSTLSL